MNRITAIAVLLTLSGPAGAQPAKEAWKTYNVGQQTLKVGQETLIIGQSTQQIGQQTLELDFLKGCLRQIEDLRRSQAETANPLSAGRSGKNGKGAAR